jgi:hypothetical protein
MCHPLQGCDGARAVMLIPYAVVLTNVANCAQVCSIPDRAVELAAAFVAALETNTTLPATAVDSSLSLCSMAAAVASLPFTLPTLLQNKHWQAAVPVIVGALMDIMRNGSVSAGVRQQVRAAVMSVGYGLDTKNWERLVTAS